jgi:hypothetical protein
MTCWEVISVKKAGCNGWCAEECRRAKGQEEHETDGSHENRCYVDNNVARKEKMAGKQYG